MRKNFGKQTCVYPMPVFIVGTYDENDNADAMNAAWGGIYDDYQIAICIERSWEGAGNAHLIVRSVNSCRKEDGEEPTQTSLLQ